MYATWSVTERSASLPVETTYAKSVSASAPRSKNVAKASAPD